MMLLVDPLRRMELTRALRQTPGQTFNCQFTKYRAQVWKIH